MREACSMFEVEQGVKISDKDTPASAAIRYLLTAFEMEQAILHPK